MVSKACRRLVRPLPSIKVKIKVEESDRLKSVHRA